MKYIKTGKFTIRLCTIFLSASCIHPNPSVIKERNFIDSLMKTKSYDTITTFLSEYNITAINGRLGHSGIHELAKKEIADYYFTLHLKNGINVNGDSLKRESARLSEGILRNVLSGDIDRYHTIYLVYKDKTKDTSLIYSFLTKKFSLDN